MSNQTSTFILLVNTVLCLSVLNIPTAQAGYKPPADTKTPPPNTYTGSGTTRGCDGNSISSTILASGNRVGQTMSTHPTFVWFIDDEKPHEMEFSLYEYTQNNQYNKIYQATKKTSPGIMNFTLPKNESPLKTNQIYVSQIVIFCEPNSPSTALVDQVYFEVVDVPVNLKSQLENTSNSLEKVNLYAESGLWYDAMKEALKLATPGKLGEVGATLLKELVTEEKANLNQSTNPSRIESLEKIYNLEL